MALEVERTTENSTFVQQIRLAAGNAGDRVEVVNPIDWRTLGASLRADFPLAAANPEANFDDKAGVTRRGNNDAEAFRVGRNSNGWTSRTRTAVRRLGPERFEIRLRQAR